MAKAIINEITAIVDDLGHLDEKTGKYERGRQYKKCIRDLIVCLKRDDRENTARWHLGNINLVQNDLIPLLGQHCSKNKEICQKALALTAFLTEPISYTYEQVPEEPTERQRFLEICSHLERFKVSFANDKDVWTLFATQIRNYLNLEELDIKPIDSSIFQGSILTIANVLNAPLDLSLEKNTSDDTTTQDLIIERMQKSNLLDLLIEIAKGQHPVADDVYFFTLNIIYQMLKGRGAEFLAKSVDLSVPEESLETQKRNYYEKKKDSDDLKALIEQDRQSKGQALAPNRPVNRFKETTLVLKNVKSISDRDLIYHKPTTDRISFDDKKKRVKLSKLKKPLIDADCENGPGGTSSTGHRSNYRVRTYLVKFCNEFLESGAYNSLMEIIKGFIDRDKAHADEKLRFLWALQFFMEFNRSMGKKGVDLVSEVMNREFFHYVHKSIDEFKEHMTMEKKGFQAWSVRMHYGIKAYREYLMSLIYASKFPEYDDLCKGMQEMAFVDPDYRMLPLEMILHYNEVKMSKALLKDVIETTHIYMKMLEHYSKGNELIVKEKKKKRKKPSSRKGKNKKMALEPADLIWSEIAAEISEKLQAEKDTLYEDDPETAPYDAASDQPMEEQKTMALYRLQQLLRQRKVGQAIALLRNAREVWIDDAEAVFGGTDIQPDQELDMLREILNAEFPDEVQAAYESMKNGNDEEDPEKAQGSEDEEAEPAYTYEETKFDFTGYLACFCHPKVIQAYTLLLKTWATNSPETNKCIVKMFHRLAVGYSMTGLFYHASLFLIFRQIIDKSYTLNPSADQNDPSTAVLIELIKFAKFIVRKFVECVPRNNKILGDLLFWKTRQEALATETGNYLVEEPAQTKKKEKKAKQPKEKGGKGRKKDFLSESFINEESDEDINVDAFDRLMGRDDEVHVQYDSDDDDDNEEINQLFKGMDNTDPAESAYQFGVDEILSAVGQQQMDFSTMRSRRKNLLALSDDENENEGSSSRPTTKSSVLSKDDVQFDSDEEEDGSNDVISKLIANMDESLERDANSDVLNGSLFASQQKATTDNEKGLLLGARKQKKVLLIESEDEDDDRATNPTHSPGKERERMVESDEEQEAADSDKTARKPKKKLVIESDDEDDRATNPSGTPAKIRASMIQSDEESTSNAPPSPKRAKKKLVIESDDEDDRETIPSQSPMKAVNDAFESDNEGAQSTQKAKKKFVIESDEEDEQEVRSAPINADSPIDQEGNSPLVNVLNEAQTNDKSLPIDEEQHLDQPRKEVSEEQSPSIPAGKDTEMEVDGHEEGQS